MKGSHVLKKRWLLCSLLSASLAEADQNYLSNLKEEQFSYDAQNAQIRSDILRDSWLQPLQLRYSYMRSNSYGGESTIQNSSVSIDQPIFQSGGIYYGIKFAEASRRYSEFSIDAARQKLIKEAVALLIQIRQSDLKIRRQELLIANSGLNLEFKTEQYLHGDLDSGFLDNAIIEKNLLTQTLFDLQNVKEKLVSSFESISDLEYEKAPLPKLELITEEKFESEATDLKLLESEREKNRWNQNSTRAKYLPKVSLTASYNRDLQENPAFAGQVFNSSFATTYHTYGLKASMNLDFNQFRDMEAARIETLKSEVAKSDKRRELKSMFDQVRHNLSKLDKKIALSGENRALYKKLLEDTRELFKAGVKTEYDVNIMENSYTIQGLETEIIEFDRQLELLTLYEKVYGAI